MVRSKYFPLSPEHDGDVYSWCGCTKNKLGRSEYNIY